MGYGMKILVAVLAVVAMLAGCAKEVPTIPHKEVHSYDKDTNFAIKEDRGGFMLTVDYYNDQTSFFFDIGVSGATNSKCQSKLISIARDLSDKTGRKIKPVNPEGIKISISDSRACHAQYKVEWE